MSEQPLLNGSIILRPDDKGRFDELLMMENGNCTVHAEMMDKDFLWIGFYPNGGKDRVVMWITTKGGKLKVSAKEDN